MLSYTKVVAKHLWVLVFCLAPIFGMPGAQANPLESGWVLQPESSSLKFQTIKNLTKVESSQFYRFSGAILPDGYTEVEIDLASVDTKVDLRNVRMRFLLFETFVFPTAKISAQINADDFADLAEVKRKTLQLPYRLSLHGIEQDAVAEVSVTLLSDDLVLVSTATPISIAAASFNLAEGIARLEDAADVAIIPSATVSFDFLFKRHSGTPLAAIPPFELLDPAAAGATTATASATVDTATPAKVVAEPVADPFSAAECRIRYKVIGQLGPLVFVGDSTDLGEPSRQLLADVSETIKRCPEGRVEIGAHTFAKDDSAANQDLSDEMATVVRDYLVTLNIDPARLIPAGYGDAFPRVPLGTARSLRINQRIEFSPVGQ